MSARGALAFLLIRSIRNRLGRQLRRVRSPRYAIALLAGLAYFALLIGNPRDRGDMSQFPADVIEVMVAAGTVLVVAWSWVRAGDRSALAFTPAEVTFLFPAPITRRTLVRFKLARAQVLLLLNTAIWTFLLDAGRPGLPTAMRAVGVWLALSTLQLHRLGATLVRTSLGEHGWHGLRRSAVSALLAVAGASLIIGAFAQALPTLLTITAIDEVAPAVDAISARPLPRILIAPFRALLAPLYADGPLDWWRAVGPALLILLLHYVWVMRSDTAFEEAAADASFARSRELASRRTGASVQPYSPPLVALAPTGRPGTAIFWKNVTMVLRRRRARILALAFVAALACGAAAQELAPRVAQTMGTLLLMWAGLLAAVGPQWARNDLRSDLTRLDLLRSFPLDGGAIVRAESAASALVVTLAQWVMLSVGVVTLWGNARWSVTAPPHAALLIGGMLLVPFVNFIGLMLFNGGALLYPAWVTPGAARGGVDTLGQNLLTAVAYLIAMAIALAAPAGLAALAWTGLAGLGPWAAIPAAGAAAGGLALEAWLLSLWLGGVFERTDPPAAGIETAA